MNSPHVSAHRFIPLVLLMVTLVLVSSRWGVADTGVCGGANITLPFSDVAGTNIFFCSIAQAYLSGLTNGTSSTTYSPGANVTREQIAAFITRTQDSVLRRGSYRAALGQWWTPRDPAVLRATDVGDNPNLVACDGDDLWVANALSSTVTRVHASDGKVLGTWTGATFAAGVLVAAGRIFITGDALIGQLYSIDPTQPPGAVTTVAGSLGGFPYGATYDGLNVWTANQGGGLFEGSISKVNIASGASSTFFGFNRPVGALYDGVNLWVTDYGDASLKRIDIITGAVLQTLGVGVHPGILTFDGTNIWVPNSNSNSVTVVRAVGSLQGMVLATLTGNGLNGPFAAAFDGERVLVTNADGGSVSLWKAADLTPLGSVSAGTGTVPIGACSDGINFWVTLNNTDKVVRF